MNAKHTPYPHELSIRLLMVEAERDRLREENAELVETLGAALESYRPSFRHPGIGRHEPYPIADPAWVVEARAALEAAKEGA